MPNILLPQSDFNELTKCRLVFHIETKPLSDEYVQVALSEAQFSAVQLYLFGMFKNEDSNGRIILPALHETVNIPNLQEWKYL